jgi:hypothetical protein
MRSRVPSTISIVRWVGAGVSSACGSQMPKCPNYRSGQLLSALKGCFAGAVCVSCSLHEPDRLRDYGAARSRGCLTTR